MAERILGAVGERRILQLVVFRLVEDEFCVAIDAVQEIIRMGNVTPIPDSPDFIKGVINVRGEIVATIDLGPRFFLQSKPNSESKHIIITQQQGSLFGLVVGEVTEVLRIPEEEIKPPPQLMTKLHQEYVSGVITLGDRLILLLDLARVLSEEEISRLTEVRRRQRSEPEPAPHMSEDQPTETGIKAAARKAQQSEDDVAENNKGQEPIAEHEVERHSLGLSKVAQKRRRGRK